MSVSDMSEWMAKFPQSWVESRYGLEDHEWAGSLSDRVMAIINKNDPAREDRVNALLYDNALLLEKRFQGYRRLGPDEDLIDYAEFRDAISHVVENGVSINDETYSQIHYVATYDDMKSDACAYGYDLRDAIEEAVENGILIKAETMNAIKRVEHNYVTPYGGESLTRQYDKLCELNDARKHYHETAPTLASSSEKKPEIDESRFMLDELGNLQSKGHGIAGFETILSTGLGQRQQFTFTDGQPLAPSTPSQGSRQGSIAAALPGSSITVGRRTPRVASHTGTSAAERYGLVADEVQQREDDGFEL